MMFVFHSDKIRELCETFNWKFKGSNEIYTDKIERINTSGTQSGPTTEFKADSNSSSELKIHARLLH